MDFAYVATGPSVVVFFGFFFLDFFFRNRPLPKKNFFFFFGEKFCDVEKKKFFLGGREAWEAGPPGREAWASSEPCVKDCQKKLNWREGTESHRERYNSLTLGVKVFKVADHPTHPLIPPLRHPPGPPPGVGFGHLVFFWQSLTLTGWCG